jgi:hypothetical protein
MQDLRGFGFGYWKAKIVVAPLILLPKADPRQLRKALHTNLGVPTSKLLTPTHGFRGHLPSRIGGKANVC